MTKVLPKKWTKKESDFIEENYLSMNNAELAEKLKATPKSIEEKIEIMKLKRVKPIEENEEEKWLIIHQNIRCRTCFLIDGYIEAEKNCRHCNAKLFKLDMI